MSNGIVKLIYYTFNDVVKVIKSEYGIDVSYMKCSILNNNKKDYTIRAGDTVFVNYNLGLLVKRDSGIEYDNLKKYFVLSIAKELGKEVINKFFNQDLKNRWLEIIVDYDELALVGPSNCKDGGIEPLSDFFALTIFNSMLPKLNEFVKKYKKGDNTNVEEE